jgi:hypothetical protein
LPLIVVIHYLYENNVILLKYQLMKKLLLLTVTSCFAAAAFAQQSANQSVVLKDHQGPVYKPVMMDQFKGNAAKSANKTNAEGGQRWYNPFELANQYLGNILNSSNQNTFVFPIGTDSTLRQQYNTGPGPVNYLAMAQFVDPIRSEGFNTAGSGFGETNDIRINWWNNYKVDSVQFLGAYMNSSLGNKPGVVDTFVISVAPVPYSRIAEVATSGSFKFAPTEYKSVNEKGGGKLRVMDDIPANVGAHDMNMGVNLPGVKTFKIAIPDTMRKDRTATGYPTRLFEFAVPDGGVDIPAGNGFVVSVAFKIGETIAKPNEDSLQVYNYFMPLHGRAGETQIMPYFAYDYNDYNMTFLQHYRSSEYTSSIIYELINDKQFNKEFLYIGARANCTDCKVLSVANVTNFTSVKAYPNPAASEVRIPFALKNAANVKVSITNSVGQAIKTQDMGKATSGEAVFTTSDLANGVYFYTVDADGQRYSGRLAVNH